MPPLDSCSTRSCRCSRTLGGVTLLDSRRHAGVVNKLVLVSIASKRDGRHAEIVAGMAQVGAAAAKPIKQTAIYKSYPRIVPNLADWPMLLTKT
jgi:hypothetical protein